MTRRQIKIEKIDPSLEKLIVTGMIIDTKFISEIAHSAKKEYFKGTFTGIVAEWCREYFAQQKKAPGSAIHDIFIIKKDTEFDDEEGKEVIGTIKEFLENILNNGNKTFNTDYVLRKAFAYLQENSLYYRLEKSNRLLKNGDVEGALKVLRETGKEVFSESRRAITFPDADELYRIYNSDRESIMRMPGELGRYIGPLRRGKYFALLGPTKRGKTHWLIEFAYQAVVSGLKVYFFSLEVPKEDIEELVMMRFLNKEIIEGDEQWLNYEVPVFDCMLNQTGECSLDICTSPDSCVFDEDTGKLEEYDREMEHIPCTECLNREELKENYKQSTWFLTIKRETIKSRDIQLFVDAFDRQMKGSLKIKSYPISTATIEDIENDLDKEEAYNNWVADVVVIDSLDNFKKNLKLGDKRHQLSEIWEEISRITKTRNYLTFTATQGNRGSFQKDRLEATDTAEDWSKAMVLDGLLAINERGTTLKENVLKDKYWKRQQLEWLLHRYKKTIPYQQCMILQNFDLGQTVLDSQIYMYESIKGGK